MQFDFNSPSVIQPVDMARAVARYEKKRSHTLDGAIQCCYDALHGMLERYHRAPGDVVIDPYLNVHLSDDFPAALRSELVEKFREQGWIVSEEESAMPGARIIRFDLAGLRDRYR